MPLSRDEAHSEAFGQAGADSRSGEELADDQRRAEELGDDYSDQDSDGTVPLACDQPARCGPTAQQERTRIPQCPADHRGQETNDSTTIEGAEPRHESMLDTEAHQRSRMLTMIARGDRMAPTR